MQTLEQLKSGQLVGCRRLQLSEAITEFPREIFTLADTLEILDLSHNQLRQLPDDFATLHQLKILFLSYNCFESLPEVLGQCPQLEMIGFKANQIKTVSEHALPVHTRWLILTDNQIEPLPNAMGKLYRLQKLALAGNRLTHLPDTMADCHALELVRLSANRLASLPQWLLTLPKLTWLAFAGNPFSHVSRCDNHSVPTELMSHLQLGEQLGQGASGVIYRARWNGPNAQTAEVAVKLFKGDITSDGYPADELDCCLSAGEHPNLIKVLAQINTPEQLGLIMALIPHRYQNLGLPPSLQSCTRDTFAAGTEFSAQQIARMAVQLADVLAQLHANGVSHGDIYAHNTMVDEEANLLFGDFGAASNLVHLSAEQRKVMEAIEVRALGCFIEDLLSCCHEDKEQVSTLKHKLQALSAQCMQHDGQLRPTFNAIYQSLTVLD